MHASIKWSQRKINTIMDTVRCIFKAKQMSREFWAKATANVVYILNKCPTKSVHDNTPKWKETINQTPQSFC